MWKKYDKHSATYHSKNNLKNFQFLISFKNVSSLVKIPKLEKGGSDAESLTADGEESLEEVRIGWQEKIFSAAELERYSEVKNCSNAVQRKYHDLITNSESAIRSGKIFTYVHEDRFRPKYDEFAQYNQTTSDTSSSTQEEVMHVLVNLDHDVLLFQARWIPKDRLLAVYPDFNSFTENPYNFEIDTDYRHLYLYAVRNASKMHSPTVDVLKPEQLHTTVHPATDLSGLFDLTPKLSTRFEILFEIQSAVGFEYDTLHVRYNIIVPERFKLENGQTTGSSHSLISSSSTWNFGHTFDLTIISATEIPVYENFNIFFELISIDGWTRERVEGYGHVTFGLYPQRTSVEVRCFRIDYGFWERIARFFIGGRRQFDLKQFNKMDGGFLNRYGSRTVSTGKLRILCQIIKQVDCQSRWILNSDRQTKGFHLDDLMKRHHEARSRLQTIIG